MCGEKRKSTKKHYVDYRYQNRPVFDRRLQMPRTANSHVDYYPRNHWIYRPSRLPSHGRYVNPRGFGRHYRGRGRINGRHYKNDCYTFTKQRRIQERDPKWTSITYNVAGSSKPETLFLMNIDGESIEASSFNLDVEKETESTPRLIQNEQQTTDVPKQVEENMEMSSNNNNKCVSPSLYDMRIDAESKQCIQNKGVKEEKLVEPLPTQVAFVFSCYGNDFITPEDNKNHLSDDKSETKTTKVKDKPNIDDMTQEELFALATKLQQVIRDTSPSSMSRLLPSTLQNKDEIPSKELDVPSNSDGIVTNINDIPANKEDAPEKTDCEITPPQVQSHDSVEDSSQDEEVFQKKYKRIKRRSRLKERAPLNECTNKEVKIVLEKIPDTTVKYWQSKSDHNRNLSSDTCKIKTKPESTCSKKEKPLKCEKEQRECLKDKRKHAPSSAAEEGEHSKSKKVKENSSQEPQTETGIDVSDLLDQALENSDCWKTMPTKMPRGERNETKSSRLPSFPVKIKIKQPDVLQHLHSESKGKPSDTKGRVKESKRPTKECESQNSPERLNSVFHERKVRDLFRLEKTVDVTSPKLCEKQSMENLDQTIIKKKKRHHSKESEKSAKKEHKSIQKNATTIEKEISAKGRTVDNKATGTEKHKENKCTTRKTIQKLPDEVKGSSRKKMLIAKKKHEEHFAENYLHKKIRQSCKFTPVTGIVAAPHHFDYLLEDFEKFQKLEDDVVRVEVVASGVATTLQIPAVSSGQTEQIDRSETKKNVAEDTAEELTPSAVESAVEIERPSSAVSSSSTVNVHAEQAEEQILSSDDCAPAPESREIGISDKSSRDMPDLNALWVDASFYAVKEVVSSTEEISEEVVSSQGEANSQEIATSMEVATSVEKNQEDVVPPSLVEYLQEVVASLMENQQDDAQSIEESHQEGNSAESREEVASSARKTQQEVVSFTVDNQQEVVAFSVEKQLEIDASAGDNQEKVPAFTTEYQLEVAPVTGENQREVAASSEGNQQEVAAFTGDNQPKVAAFTGEHQQEVAPGTVENQREVDVSSEENQRKVALSSEVKQQVKASLVPSSIGECPREKEVIIHQNIIICQPAVQPEILPDTNKTQATVVTNLYTPPALADTPAEVDWQILFAETYNPPVINHIVDKPLAKRLCACYEEFLNVEMIYNRQLFENASGIPKGIRTTALDYRLHLSQNAAKFEQLLLMCSSEDTLEEFLQMLWRAFRRENICVYICCLIRLLQDVKCCSPWVIYLLDRLSILFFINPEAFAIMMDIKFKHIEVTKRETLLHHLTLRCQRMYSEKVPFGASDEHKDYILRSFIFRHDTNVRECNMESLTKFATKKVRSTDAIMEDWLNWNSTDPKIAVRCPETLTGVISNCGNATSHRVPAKQSPAHPSKPVNPHHQIQQAHQRQQQKSAATSQLAKKSQFQLCPSVGLNSHYRQQENSTNTGNTPASLVQQPLQSMGALCSQYQQQQKGTNTGNCNVPLIQQLLQSRTASNPQYQQQSNGTYMGNASAPPVQQPLQSMTVLNSQYQQQQRGANTGNASAQLFRSMTAMLTSNMSYNSTQRPQYHHSGASQPMPPTAAPYMSYSYQSTRGQIPLSNTYGYQQQGAYSSMPQYQQSVGFNAAVPTNVPLQIPAPSYPMQQTSSELQAQMQGQQAANFATRRLPCQNQTVHNLLSTSAPTEHHPQRRESQTGCTNRTYRPSPSYNVQPQFSPISQTSANGVYNQQIPRRQSNDRSDTSTTSADFNARTQQTQMAYSPQHAVPLPSTDQAGAGRMPVPRSRNGSSSSATTADFPHHSPRETQIAHNPPQMPKQPEQTASPGTQREPRPRSNQRSNSNSSSEHVVGQTSLQGFSDRSNDFTPFSSASRGNSTETLDLVKFYLGKLQELMSQIRSDGGTVPEELQGMIGGNSSSTPFNDADIQVLKGMIAKQSAITNEIIVIKDEDDFKEEIFDSDQAFYSNRGYAEPLDNELTEDEHLEPHDVYTCICGAIADKKCACNTAIYCSEECRLKHLPMHLRTCLLSNSC